MRFLLKVTLPVETANRGIRDGTFQRRIQEIIGDLKPEAVYFGAENGHRTAFLVVDMREMSQMPAIAEPFFLSFNADIAFYPVMIPEDLAKGNLTSLGKRWGELTSEATRQRAAALP
jgi:hypothetical protein